MPRSLLLLLFLVAALVMPRALLAAGDETARELEEKAADAVGESESGRIGEGAEPRRTLAERIPSVTRRTFVKRGRAELTPMVGMSLNDPFYDHVVGSFGVGYHVFESLAIGASGQFYQSLASEVPLEGRQGGYPTLTLDRPVYGARLEVLWSPLYGKLSLLAEAVAHFDTYLLVGGGMLSRKESGTTAAAVAGIGEHIFVNEWLSMRFELRDEMFMLDRSQSDSKSEKLQHLMVLSVGASFYLPTTFQREQL